ncbi:carboxylesterase/lipase family protein [Agromyces badenianii]|uniref:carboxylesterase/lipase family protein n=1 Tax=Agromyces badenianii TaxID=2080742 RepID=UPI001F2751D9|nr:carboxylesterase family protein [Agromyces badenianii]
MQPLSDERSPLEGVIETSTGALRGETIDGIARFLGVPYASPPFGEHRFRLPAPVEPWEGVRDATAFGPTAPQVPYAGALGELLPTVAIPGEGILNVNIWAPTDAAGAPWPVMVWMHGGSLKHGSNALPGYDGTTFARDGVVFVSVNYRLGTEGFSVLDGAPLNLGLHDQLAALRWVQREIAAFGGDPARVTVFGQSAGGATVAALAASPIANEVMQRAIVMSGPLEVKTPADAGRITALIARELGIAATRDAFAAVAPERLAAAQAKVIAGSSPLGGGPAFTIAIDGDLVPTSPADAFAAGASSNVPLLIGTTTEEYRLWLVPSGAVDRITRLHLAIGRRAAKISAAAVRRYRANRPGAKHGEVFGAILTDVLLRRSEYRVADARAAAGAPTWVYEFAWRSPVRGLGAAHAVELGFVFDGLAAPDSVALAGASAPQVLASAIHDAWVAFAASGEPGWPGWGAGRTVRIFDGIDDPAVPAPRLDELAELGR